MTKNRRNDSPPIRHIERLESRQLLTAVQDASQVDAHSGNQAICRPYDTVVLDLNLDGRFNSADLVAAVRIPTRLRDIGKPATEILRQSIDLVHALRVNAYESTDLPGDRTCTATETDADQETRYDDYHDDSRSIRESVTYVRSGPNLKLREAKYFDSEEQLRTRTKIVFRTDSSPIHTRQQQDYDQQGRLTREQTQLYYQSGAIRRMITATYVNNHPLVSKIVDRLHFDESGNTTLQHIQYLDGAGADLDSDVFYFAENSSHPIIHRQSASAFRDRLSNDQTPQPHFELNDADFMLQLHEAHQISQERLKNDYSDILRMNLIPAQINLENLIYQARISPSETERFRNLNRYFEIVSSIAEATIDGEFSEFHDEYTREIEVSTGDWTERFRSFASSEGLSLPLAPLRFHDAPLQLTNRQTTLLANWHQTTIGRDPFAHFEQRHQNLNVSKILESMRKVKTTVKILELKVTDSAPTFEWIVMPDKPDLSAAGLQDIGTMTSWFFFTRENGIYLNDEPNEEVIKRRVEAIEDEDQFYVMDIEHWPLDGTQATIDASISKLKRTADLVHKYNPNLLIGYYRLLPKRNANIRTIPAHVERATQWQAHNDHLAASLEDSVDILFPSLYTVHLGEADRTTEDLWQHFANSNIREAQRLSNGKPVLPFLALFYHGNNTRNPKAWAWVEPELLLYQMLTVHQSADGLVLYNTFRHSWNVIEDAGLVDALQMFHFAKDHQLAQELLAYIQQLHDEHHDELVLKLELELRILELQKKLRGLPISASQRIPIQTEIDSAQVQLTELVDLWGKILQFEPYVDFASHSRPR